MKKVIVIDERSRNYAMTGVIIRYFAMYYQIRLITNEIVWLRPDKIEIYG